MRLLRADGQLFPLHLLGVVLSPTMLEVTSGYSTLENVLFLQERRPLAELESSAADNRLKTNGLLIRELQ